MAKYFGNNSRYLIFNEKLNSIGKYTYISIFVYVLYLIVFKNYGYLSSVTGIMGLVIAFSPLVYWISKLISETNLEEIKFKQGAKAEWAVGYELGRFSDDYCIFQDVKIPGRKDNIDFVVLGPTGIYTLEVKSENGRIRFDGQKLDRDKYGLNKDFLEQAMNWQAMPLHDYLKEKTGREIFINSVVVFSRADVRLGLEKYRGVYVIGKKWLHKLIVEQGEQGFNPETFELLKEELTRLIAIK